MVKLTKKALAAAEEAAAAAARLLEAELAWAIAEEKAKEALATAREEVNVAAPATAKKKAASESEEVEAGFAFATPSTTHASSAGSSVSGFQIPLDVRLDRVALIRKRKAADVEELKFDESTDDTVDSALKIYCKLFAANMQAMFHLRKASNIAAAEAMEVVAKQGSLIIELKDLILNSGLVGSMAFSKAKELADLADDLQPVLKHLPDVSMYLEKQAALIYALKLHFYI